DFFFGLLYRLHHVAENKVNNKYGYRYSTLIAFALVFGIGIWERTFLIVTGGILIVVGKADIHHPDAILVQDRAFIMQGKHHIAAPVIAVLGLAHRANVNGVAVVGRALFPCNEDAVVRLVGMAKTHDVGIRVFHDAQQAFLVPVFKQVLV